MPELLAAKTIMGRIGVIAEHEEPLFSEIPNWDGHYEAATEKALALNIGDQTVWFPISQLRRTEDRTEVYASDWLLGQKGLS